MTTVTMMTVILRYPHTKGYPNGIVITVIIVTENADVIGSACIWADLAVKDCCIP